MPVQRVFTVAEARAILPLVRSIVRDVRDVWRKIITDPAGADVFFGRRKLADCSTDELNRLQNMEQELSVFSTELQQLGIELKSPETGLVDFPSVRNGSMIYLCWRDGEPDVLYWHSIETGYLGRQLIEEGEVTVYKLTIESSIDLNHPSE